MSVVRLLLGFSLLGMYGLAQRVGIGTSNPHSSARLDVVDTARGVLIPRMTTAERNAIPTPARSLLIYNLDCDAYQYFIPGTGWVTLLSTASGGGTGGGGTLTALSATGVGPNGFTAHWTPVAGATSYEIRVYQNCNSNTVITTVTTPNGTMNSYFLNTSLPCNAIRCYEVRTTISSSTSCGNSTGLLVSNRVPVNGTHSPCGASNAWVKMPDPPNAIPLHENEVAISHKGYIYIGFGGVLSGGPTCANYWWRWDPCNRVWTSLSTPPINFGQMAFGFAIGDYIYVGGGGFGCGGPLSDFYRYDPITNSWTARNPLPQTVYGAAGTSDDTYGYVAGGVTTSGGARTTNIYRYNPITDSWVVLTTIPGLARHSPILSTWQNKLYVGGGSTSGTGPFSGCLNDFHIYDMATNTWSILTSHPNTSSWEGWAYSHNSIIYVTGHHPDAGSCDGFTAQYYYYNIATNTWHAMPIFPGGGRNNIHIVQVDGIFYGGFGKSGSFGPYHRDWWAFCP